MPGASTRVYNGLGFFDRVNSVNGNVFWICNLKLHIQNTASNYTGGSTNRHSWFSCNLLQDKKCKVLRVDNLSKVVRARLLDHRSLFTARFRRTRGLAVTFLRVDFNLVPSWVEEGEGERGRG